MRQFFLLDWVGKHKVAALVGGSVFLVLALLAGLFSSQLRTQVAPGGSGDPEVLGSESKTEIETGNILVRLEAAQAVQVRQQIQNYEANNGYSAAGDVLGKTAREMISAQVLTATPTTTPDTTPQPSTAPTTEPIPTIPADEASPTPSVEAEPSTTPTEVPAGPIRIREISDPAVLAAVINAVPSLKPAAEQIQAVELVTKRLAGTELTAIDRWIEVKVGESLKVPIQSEEKLKAPYWEIIQEKGMEGLLSPDHQYSDAERAALKKTTQAFLAIMPTVGGIEKTEFNLVANVTMVPNDPYYHSSGAWGQSYDDLWGIKKIESAPAWDLSQGEGVTVAVIDTGVDYTHEDIDDNIWFNSGEMSPRLLWGTRGDKRQNGIDDDGNGYIDDWRGWDFAYDDNDPMDDHGHGTHVAGTIAAEGNNEVGVIGVAPKAKVMMIKGLDDHGGGYVSALAEAVRYSADMGASVNNNSWGAFGKVDVLEDAFQYVYDKNVVSVAAAGNNGVDVDRYTGYTPASYDTVIAVAATSVEDIRAWFSNFGKKVDVAAPGVDILSLRAGQTDMYGRGNHIVGDKYYFSSGTSMASPHVAGAAALVKARHPEFSNEEVGIILKTGVDTISQEADKPIGLGRLNAAKAAADDSPLLAIVDNPREEQIVVSDDVEITGTVEGTSFSHYTVEVAMGANATNWTTQNITLSGEGKSPVKNGLLATWDTRDSSTDYFSIRVTAYDTEGESQSDIVSPTTYLEKDLVNGWPLDVAPYRATLLAIGNIDNDADKEVILGHEETLDPPYFALRAYNHDGSEVSGWPWGVDHCEATSVVLADLNNDARDEIIIPCPVFFEKETVPKIYVFESNGQLLPGWPKEIRGTKTEKILAAPAVADIDNDGAVEILMASASTNDEETVNTGPISLHAWKSNGESLLGWPASFESPVVFRKIRNYIRYQGMTVVDADGDGDKEIFFGIDNMRNNDSNYSVVLFAFDNLGGLLPGWPREVPWGGTTIPVGIGDIYGDKKAEIVALSHSEELHVLQLNGEPVAPWPKSLDHYKFVQAQASASLANLDGDEQKEIIIAGLAFNGDGSAVPGWNGFDLIYDPFSLPTLHPEINSDVTGDGKNELLFIEPKYSKFLEAFSVDGTHSRPGWPKPLNEYSINSYDHAPRQILTEDLDRDGLAEIITLTQGFYDRQEKIHVYKTPGLASAGTWPLMHKDAQHSRGYAYPNQPPVVDAGNPSYTVQLPATLTLNGTATDDWQPKPPGQVTVGWQKVSGPGDVLFQPNNALTTQVTFTVSGEYVLELTASDSQKTSSDQVKVTVIEAPAYHWTFDKDTTSLVTDTTGKWVGNKYLVSSGLNRTRTNPYNLLFNKLTNAVVFNKDFIRIGPKTVSLWVKPTTWGLTGTESRIIDNGRFILYLSSGGRTVYFTSRGLNSGYTVKANSDAIKLGQWQHIAVTRELNGQARIYINGVPSGLIQASGPPASSPNDRLVLGNNLERKRDFKGNLDDFRIYNRVLTAAEIQEIANSNKPF